MARQKLLYAQRGLVAPQADYHNFLVLMLLTCIAPLTIAPRTLSIFPSMCSKVLAISPQETALVGQAKPLRPTRQCWCAVHSASSSGQTWTPGMNNSSRFALDLATWPSVCTELRSLSLPLARPLTSHYKSFGKFTKGLNFYVQFCWGFYIYRVVGSHE